MCEKDKDVSSQKDRWGGPVVFHLAMSPEVLEELAGEEWQGPVWMRVLDGRFQLQGRQPQEAYPFLRGVGRPEKLPELLEALREVFGGRFIFDEGLEMSASFS